MNPLTERFIEAYLKNEDNAAAAYMAASKVTNRNSAAARASKLLADPKVKAAIEERRQRLRDEAHLSRMDVVSFLCDTIRTPVAQVDENSPLAQEHITEESEHRSMSRIKIPNKLEAVKILVEMMGWKAPEEHKHTLKVVIGGDAE